MRFELHQFAVIGLGSFGSRVARILGGKDLPVLAIDCDPLRVESMQDHVTQAIQLDATQHDALKNLGIQDLDTVIISLGDDFESSVLVTMILKELGVKEIIVKGVSREHRAILELLGASKVIFPEEDAAGRLARTLMEPNILDHMPLSDDHSIVEIVAPQAFAGKSLTELNLRRNYGVECLAIRSHADGRFNVIPSADMKIHKGDSMVVLALEENLEKLKNI